MLFWVKLLIMSALFVHGTNDVTDIVFVWLFIFLQAAEKALKAAQYAKDANTVSPEHIVNLTQLSRDLGHAELGLSEIAAELETLLHSLSYLHYPSSHNFPLIPHDVVDGMTSINARNLSTRIVDMCQSYINDCWPDTTLKSVNIWTSRHC